MPYSVAVETSPEIPSCVAPLPGAAVAVADPRLRGQLLEALRQFTVVEDCGSDHPELVVETVTRSQPAVLLLSVGPGCAATLSRLAQLDPAPRIVAVASAAAPEVILEAMRAGAAEFVYPPFEAAFNDAMRRVAASCSEVPDGPRSGGSVIGFVSVRGGSGATTLACHAARHLRQAAKQGVLLADLDTASGIAGLLMQAVARYSLEDALHNLHRMDRQLWKAMVAESPSGVDVIQSSAELPGLWRGLPQLVDFWRAQYETTLLDLGHGITPALLSVLDSVDTLVLVSTNELISLRLTRQMIQALAQRNFGGDRLKLAINRMPKRSRIPAGELEGILGHPIFQAIHNDYSALDEAYSQTQLLAANNPLATEIGELGLRLAGIAPAAATKRSLFSFRKGKH